MRNESDKESGGGLFDRPAHTRWAVFFLCCACTLSVVAEFFISRHIVHDWEGLFAFHGLYGFVACVLLVWFATLLRRVVMRQENYYDD